MPVKTRLPVKENVFFLPDVPHFEKPDFYNISDVELMKYCKQDTIVLATLMKKHIQLN